MEIFGISSQALMGQLFLGLINGSFYAVLSLGLAIIFGLLNIINFSHGALYMMGAFVSWLGLTQFGVSYWTSLVLTPVIVGVLGIVIERLLLRHLYQLDHLYSLLLTFGLALSPRACSRMSLAFPVKPMRCPSFYKAVSTLDLCTCRCTADGSCWPR